MLLNIFLVLGILFLLSRPEVIEMILGLVCVAASGVVFVVVTGVPLVIVSAIAWYVVVEPIIVVWKGAL